MGFWNVLGQVLSLAGVVMLFYFGMPFHLPTKGAQFLAWGKSEEAIKKEEKFTVLGYIGFGLTIIGTLLQIYVSAMTMEPFWPQFADERRALSPPLVSPR